MAVKLRRADMVFSRWIKKRDLYTCQRCGNKHMIKSQGLHCCHFISRRNEATRFDPDNACSICYGCHSWFHQNPKEHENFMVNRLGVEIFNALQDRRRKVVKKNDKEIIERYK